jgi:hypothetical protein
MAITEPGPPRVRWGKDELLARANRWGQRQGYDLMTEANLRELIKARLLPTAIFRGRGQGLGHDALWSWVAYRRLLRVMSLRHQGARLRRYQRLALWLEGADIPIALVREDLARQVRLSMEYGVHRDLQSDRQVHPRLTASQRNSLSGILAPKNDEFLAMFNLNGAMLRASLSVITSQLPDAELRRIMGNAAEVMLGFRDGMTAADIRNDAPSSALFDADTLRVLSQDINRGRGLMARPKEGANTVLSAIECASDDLLLNVRASLLRLNPTVRALMYSVRRLVERDATMLGAFAPFQGQLVAVLRELEKSRLMPDAGARFSVFCILLLWASTGEDDGENLRRAFADLRPDVLIPYLVEHMDELENGGAGAMADALMNMRLTDSERERITAILNVDLG